MSVAEEIKDSYSMGIKTGMELVGQWVSDIINQDKDEKTDAEVIDEIVVVLKKYKIHKKR